MKDLYEEEIEDETTGNQLSGIEKLFIAVREGRGKKFASYKSLYKPSKEQNTKKYQRRKDWYKKYYVKNRNRLRNARKKRYKEIEKPKRIKLKELGEI